jgi:hypothetical protein
MDKISLKKNINRMKKIEWNKNLLTFAHTWVRLDMSIYEIKTIRNSSKRIMPNRSSQSKMRLHGIWAQSIEKFLKCKPKYLLWDQPAPHGYRLKTAYNCTQVIFAFINTLKIFILFYKIFFL